MHDNSYFVFFFFFWLECTCGQNLISEGAVCKSDSTIFLRHFLLILYINTIFFSLYIIAKYQLDETQAGNKIAGRNINNLRCR